MPSPAPFEPEVDIVSDVVCPWCIIGYLQLQKACAITGFRTKVRWHPFELNPKMPDEGQDMRAHLAEKYGTTTAQSRETRQQLAALGADLGFAFNLADDSRMVNTFRAHQMIEWADEQGRQNVMKQALFAAHFSQGRDVSSVETLADIAAEQGFDRGQALAVLGDARFAATVRAMQNFWIDRGIRGVPGMVFQKKHLLTGAQGVDTYVAMLNRLAGEAA